MPVSIYVFPSTTQCIRDRVAALRKRFRSLSVTGASSRFLNPDKVWAYEEMCQLEDFLAKAKPIPLPEQNVNAQIGHAVTLSDSSKSSMNHGNLVIHLSSEMDVKYHLAENNIEGRLLSVESPLGKQLLGKKIGDTVDFSGTEMNIEKISVSGYLS